MYDEKFSIFLYAINILHSKRKREKLREIKKKEKQREIAVTLRENFEVGYAVQRANLITGNDGIIGE